MYRTILALVMLTGTAWAQTAEAPAQPSYMILQQNPAFCDGGRFMLSAKKAPDGQPFLALKCESNDKFSMNVVGENNAVIGIVVEQPGKLPE